MCSKFLSCSYASLLDFFGIFTDYSDYVILQLIESTIACVACISVEFRSKELLHEKEGRGRGRWSKETLAVKPLDFENPPLGLSCLSDFMLSSAVIN